jgi:hypothetical protein
MKNIVNAALKLALNFSFKPSCIFLYHHICKKLSETNFQRIQMSFIGKIFSRSAAQPLSRSAAQPL